jgi:AcrR family transcriptional regulator
MKKSDQSHETRARILGVSRDLFARSGYQGAGVAEICETAGVSKGAFYHHFASKQAVLETIIHDWLTGLEPAFDLWREDSRPAPAVLQSAAAAARPAFSGTDLSRRLLLELWSQAARDPDLASVAGAPYQRYRDGLKAILSRGVREGSLRRHDTTSAAGVLISLAVGALLQSLVDRGSASEKDSGADWGRVVTDGVSMLLRGIARER